MEHPRLARNVVRIVGDAKLIYFLVHARISISMPELGGVSRITGIFFVLAV
jgi:Na+/glutamate symporter